MMDWYCLLPHHSKQYSELLDQAEKDLKAGLGVIGYSQKAWVFFEFPITDHYCGSEWKIGGCVERNCGKNETIGREEEEASKSITLSSHSFLFPSSFSSSYSEVISFRICKRWQ